MQVELEFMLRIDGNAKGLTPYKLEDGGDEAFMLLCQDAREKLNQKMLLLIEKEII